MRHQLRLAAIVLGATLVLPGAALAKDPVDRLIQKLATQGYTKVEVSRTLLGRVRIEAHGRGAEREIIINGRTGEVLRDYVEDDRSHDDDDGDDDDHKGKDDEAGGHGDDNQDDDDQDDDDQDDGDQDDDNDDDGGDEDSDDDGGDDGGDSDND